MIDRIDSAPPATGHCRGEGLTLLVGRVGTIGAARRWFEQHGSGQFFEWVVDGDLDGVALIAELDRSSRLGCVTTVVDAGCGAPSAADESMELMVRLLGAGGSYVRTGGGELSPSVADLVRAVRWGESERRRSAATHAQAMAAGVTVRSQSIVYEKTGRAGTQHVLRGLQEVAPNTLVFDEPDGVSYGRVGAELLGPAPSRIVRQLRALVDQDRVVAPPSLVGRLREATVLAFGIVVAADGSVVRESLFNNHHRDRLANLFARLPGADRLVAEVDLRDVPPAEAQGPVVILKQSSDRNYGHWVVDTLPRVVPALAALNGEPAKWVVNGVKSPVVARLYVESLGLLGVREEDVIVDDFAPKRYSEIVYPTPMSEQPSVKSPTLIGILAGLGEQVHSGVGRPEHGRRIYLSRRAYTRRRLLNEDAVFARLAAAGFELVVPETLSFREQVELFAGADLVAGVMGAAFSSLAFSPLGVRVLCLAPSLMAHDYFYDLTCHKRGRYVGVQGASVTVEGVRPMDSDFIVDLADVDRALELLA